MVYRLKPHDERRHRAGNDPWWSETWRFDAVDDTGLGLFVQFTLLPHRKACWFVAALARPGQDLILCHDTDAASPPGSVLEIRSGALWSHAICESPWQHWTVAMEAYALEMADPFDAWTNPVGIRTGLAFDLEWEHTGEVTESSEHGYEVPATVSGELQTEDTQLEISAVGNWSHRWNDRGDAWAEQFRCEGHDADNVTACWLSPGPHGDVRAWRHLVAGRWCTGTGEIERNAHI